jgi:hypothetical protein
MCFIGLIEVLKVIDCFYDPIMANAEDSKVSEELSSYIQAI